MKSVRLSVCHTILSESQQAQLFLKHLGFFNLTYCDEWFDFKTSIVYSFSINIYVEVPCKDSKSLVACDMEVKCLDVES